MAKVFISHSRKDTEIVKDVSYHMKQVQVEPLVAEFESVERPPYRTIDRMIEQSDALFFFLTPNVADSPHTRSWVDYEVSAAHALNKPVYVFEQLNRQVIFPIPFLTHYFLYDPSQKEDWNKLFEIAKLASPSIDLGAFIAGGILGAPFGPLGSLIGGAVAASMAQRQQESAIFSQDITCPYANCGISFKFYSQLYEGFRFNCPTCRRPIVWRLRDT